MVSHDVIELCVVLFANDIVLQKSISIAGIQFPVADDAGEAVQVVESVRLVVVVVWPLMKH